MSYHSGGLPRPLRQVRHIKQLCIELSVRVGRIHDDQHSTNDHQQQSGKGTDPSGDGEDS